MERTITFIVMLMLQLSLFFGAITYAVKPPLTTVNEIYYGRGEVSPNQVDPLEPMVGGYVPAQSVFLTNKIAEKTADSGVDVEGVLLKDGQALIPSHLYVDAIDEYTGEAGVTIAGIRAASGSLYDIQTIDATSATFGRLATASFHESVAGAGIRVGNNLMVTGTVGATTLAATLVSINGQINTPYLAVTTVAARTGTGITVNGVQFASTGVTFPSAITVQGGSTFAQRTDFNGNVYAHKDLTVNGTLYAAIEATSLTANLFHSSTNQYTFVGEGSNFTISDGTISTSTGPLTIETGSSGGAVVIDGYSISTIPAGNLILDSGQGDIRVKSDHLTLETGSLRVTSGNVQVGTLLPPEGQTQVSIAGSVRISDDGITFPATPGLTPTFLNYYKTQTMTILLSGIWASSGASLDIRLTRLGEIVVLSWGDYIDDTDCGVGDGVIISETLIVSDFLPTATSTASHVFAVPVMDNDVVHSGFLTITDAKLSWFAGDMQSGDATGDETSFLCAPGGKSGIVSSSVTYTHAFDIVVA